MDFFPLTIATGKAFFNRKAELDYLASNIKDAKPTLIVSTRRYGKTSLALRAIEQSKQPYARFDFLSAINNADIERAVLKGVGDLVSRLESGIKKAITLVTDLFSGLDVKVNYGKAGISFEMDRKQEKPAWHILRILERVDYLAKKYNKNIVLFFDEFQRVSEVAEDHAIESMIRQIAQESKHLTFIFSGSNRNLLYRVFNDKNRPLYKLCDRITLERINRAEYIKYLQSAAVQTWRKELTLSAIEQIMDYTECHPYYINLLCSRLWKLPSPPTLQEVDHTWQTYIAQERSQVAGELELLSKNQRKLLTILARVNGTQAPRGQEFLSLSQMSGASVAQALTFLEKKDYVFKNEKNYYCVLDPLIKAVLAD